MDLEHFASEIYRLLDKATGNAHYEINTDTKVTYPYLTYTYTRERLSTNSDGFYIDIDVFDLSESIKGIIKIENELIGKLDRLQYKTDKALFLFDFNNSSDIRTNDENLKRRTIQFYAKVWWVKPNAIQRQ